MRILFHLKQIHKYCIANNFINAFLGLNGYAKRQYKKPVNLQAVPEGTACKNFYRETIVFGQLDAHLNRICVEGAKIEVKVNNYT